MMSTIAKLPADQKEDPYPDLPREDHAVSLPSQAPDDDLSALPSSHRHMDDYSEDGNTDTKRKVEFIFKPSEEPELGDIPEESEPDDGPVEHPAAAAKDL